MSHKAFMNEQKYIDCYAIGLGITPLILVAMSKNHEVLPKVSKDWFRLPEGLELFPGLAQ